jgi:hypothetical protein
VNFDEYFGNEIEKEKEEEKSQVITPQPQKLSKIEQPKQTQNVESNKKVVNDVSKVKPTPAKNLVLNNLKKEESSSALSNTQQNTKGKIVMKKITITNEPTCKSTSKTNEEKLKEEGEKTPKTISPMKSKISFYSLKVKDNNSPPVDHRKDESISPYGKFNQTGYLYKKENKMSQDKSLKMKLMNKNQNILQESARMQMDEFKKKKVILYILYLFLFLE